MENKSVINSFLSHFKTITKHKLIVQNLCFKCGLIKQGLLHDLSKYSPAEFSTGIKYYQGYRSPIDAEKEDIGYSLCWLHHKGRNKHHYEYWFDFDMQTKQYGNIDMPLNYLIESCLDKIGAAKNYNPDNYHDGYPYDYFIKGRDINNMNENNRKRFLHLLTYLKDNGEEKTLEYYRELYKKWKKDNKFNLL